MNFAPRAAAFSGGLSDLWGVTNAGKCLSGKSSSTSIVRNYRMEFMTTQASLSFMSVSWRRNTFEHVRRMSVLSITKFGGYARDAYERSATQQNIVRIANHRFGTSDEARKGRRAPRPKAHLRTMHKCDQSYLR
jgi:hypothetical protein